MYNTTFTLKSYRNLIEKFRQDFNSLEYAIHNVIKLVTGGWVRVMSLGLVVYEVVVIVSLSHTVTSYIRCSSDVIRLYDLSYAEHFTCISEFTRAIPRCFLILSIGYMCVCRD